MILLKDAIGVNRIKRREKAINLFRELKVAPNFSG